MIILQAVTTTCTCSRALSISSSALTRVPSLAAGQAALRVRVVHGRGMHGRSSTMSPQAQAKVVVVYYGYGFSWESALSVNKI